MNKKPTTIKQKPKIFRILFYVFIILLSFAICYFGFQAYQGNRQGLKTYESQEYGFKFQYPKDLKIKSLGPNSSKQQPDRGEQISGTAIPRYETLGVLDSDEEEQFSLAIFLPNHWSLERKDYKDSFYLHDSCDLRWLTPIPQITTREFNTNGVQVLEVVLSHPSLYAECYYFKSGSGHFISLYTPLFKNQSEFEKNSIILKEVLSTLSYSH